MTEDLVLTDYSGSIATITLNNPAKRNTLSIEMMTAVIDAFETVAKSNALGVILAANGPVFSAGHNFGDMLGATAQETTAIFALCTRMMDTIQSIPQPVIAKVASLATAAGCQLVATCDLAIAADTAAFAIPGGKGGLFCHTPLVAVARNVGRKRALELALTGDPIDAATAADWGLINRAVPLDKLDAAVDDLIRRATRGASASKALGKAAFYKQVGLDQDDAYTYAVEVMGTAAAGPDAQEGISAFLEKRKPSFH